MTAAADNSVRGEKGVCGVRPSRGSADQTEEPKNKRLPENLFSRLCGRQQRDMRAASKVVSTNFSFT
jgi:hypothetical protein